MEDRMDRNTLRDACQNAMAISVLVLGDRLNHRLVSGVTMAALPLKDWHVHQNRTLRCAKGSIEWLTEQVSGMYMHHVNLIV